MGRDLQRADRSTLKPPFPFPRRSRTLNLLPLPPSSTTKGVCGEDEYQREKAFSGAEADVTVLELNSRIYENLGLIRSSCSMPREVTFKLVANIHGNNSF